MRTPTAVPAWLKVGAMVVAMTLAGATAQAQQRTLHGIVTDSAGHPLQNAEVRIMELGRVTRTDSIGNFSITRISSRVVDITVRRLGYQMRFVRISMFNGEGDSVRVALTAEPVMLPGVEIEATESIHPNFMEFEGRRARGIGSFITQADIEKLNTSYTSDAFRRLPGMRFVSVNGGQGVRFVSAIGSIRGRGNTDCMPTIFVDGQAAPGMEVDEIRIGDIYGMEIYRGVSTTPVQFAKGGTAQCGTIVVWTKRKK